MRPVKTPGRIFLFLRGSVLTHSAKFLLEWSNIPALAHRSWEFKAERFDRLGGLSAVPLQ